MYAGYNDYRELCELQRAQSFEDLLVDITDSEHIRTLSLLYRYDYVSRLLIIDLIVVALYMFVDNSSSASVAEIEKI